jgi:phosphatidylglycerol lysyltransferase
VYKLGEYAYVPLPEFSIKGKARSDLRQALNRGEREQMSIEVLPPGLPPGTLAELRAISDAWLDEHSTAEKGFSLGSFSEPYLQRVPIAMVRAGSRPVAFATLMTTERAEEASVDLMRHVPGAPNGTMDFLFTQLMLHYKAQGVQRFALGMAPMAGMETHELAPRWHRFGRWLFHSGESFYNFRGLRSFKDKFHPVWEPRYLAAPQGVATLLSLADVTALIAGGLRGVFSK